MRAVAHAPAKDCQHTVPVITERSHRLRAEIDTTAAKRDGLTMLTTPLSVRQVRTLLQRARVFEHLAAFDPRWVGSIPLDIHGAGADADIACSGGRDLAIFRRALETAFADHGVTVIDNVHAGEASVIARFTLDGLPIEVFGRKRPVETHESYVHWLAEDRLLRLAGETLRKDVRAAKAGGLKTEPAFAKVLNLGGDPHSELLKLASPGDEALLDLLGQAGYGPHGRET